MRARLRTGRSESHATRCRHQAGDRRCARPCHSPALATYAGGPCSGYSIDEIAAYLDSQGELIPRDSLARKFRSYNDLVAYLQAGSFFGYLLENYGLPRVRTFWEQGFERFERIFKKTPAVVDAEWRNHLKVLYPEPSVDWAPLKKNGCQ